MIGSFAATRRHVREEAEAKALLSAGEASLPISAQTTTNPPPPPLKFQTLGSPLEHTLKVSAE